MGSLCGFLQAAADPCKHVAAQQLQQFVVPQTALQHVNSSAYLYPLLLLVLLQA
jgi:hypothetical protein